MRIIELQEYTRRRFARGEIPDDAGETLWRNYHSQVDVQFPSPRTDGMWELTSQGWVGFIPLTIELGISLQPKVEDLGNLFRMLEYAYRLKSFRFLEGLVDCRSLEEYYERLAYVLARRVLDRGRRGFYRAYLAETERLPYVRGRLDVRRALHRPWDVHLHCHYEEHTADIAENQLLAWTLRRITQSGICTERVLPSVRQAYRSLQRFITPTPFRAEDCVDRLYNRLNIDYQPLHALCRFFLEHSGPSHELGDRTMLPFLVNMARLYELFVAEWLKANLPDDLTLRAQEKVEIGQEGQIAFNIDLVLYDEAGQPRWVLDTKYKTPESPSPDDIAQIVAYAEMKRCHEGVLIYPTHLVFDEHIGDIRVRSLAFALDGDLEDAGQAFLRDLTRSEQVSVETRAAS